MLDAYVRQVNPGQILVLRSWVPHGANQVPLSRGGTGSPLTEEAGEAWGPATAYRNILNYVTHN